MDSKKIKTIDITAIIGWIISSIIVLYCLHYQVNAPFIVELYIICTAAMSGLDEVVKGYIKYKLTNRDEKK